jgi:putative ABC transport system permease protein
MKRTWPSKSLFQQPARNRIVRQLLTESLVLSLLGGTLGLGVARVVNAALLSFLPPQQAFAAPNLRLEMDARLLGFVLLLSCATCLLFGVLPALRVTGNVAAGALKTGAGADDGTELCSVAACS